MTCVPCIVCHKELEEVFSGPAGMVGTENQAAGGCAFISHGQYGSTVFDAGDGTFLEINICDECIVAASEAQRVLVGRDRQPVTVEQVYTPQGRDGTHGEPRLLRMRVGSHRTNVPLAPWSREHEPQFESLDLELEEVEQFLFDDDFRWNLGVETTRQLVHEAIAFKVK